MSFPKLINRNNLKFNLNNSKISVHPAYRRQMYICTRRLLRLVATSLFVLVLATTGFFYAKIILTLKRGVGGSSRKKTLTQSFICLWIAWFVQSIPFIVYDLCDTWAVADIWIPTRGLGPSICFYMRDANRFVSSFAIRTLILMLIKLTLIIELRDLDIFKLSQLLFAA